MKVEVADLESITLGRRLKEILSDKGKAFSLRAMEMKTGISKDVLLRIMKGERYFKPSEIELVAKALDMTIERFKGIDIQKHFEEINRLVSKQVNLQRALELATEIAPLAVGFTEKFNVSNNLGAIYYLTKNYTKARDSYLEALEQAQKIKESSGDTLPLFKVISNLSDTYTVLKDYPALHNIFRDIEGSYENFDPRYAGTLCYSQAMLAYSMGNLEECRDKMYKYQSYYSQVGLPLLKGIACQNVGYIEYLLGNYEISKRCYETAIELLVEYDEHRLVSTKDYVKTLLKLSENENAVALIEKSVEEIKKLSFPSSDIVQAKFLLLKAISTDDVISATAVFSLENVPNELKLLSCDFLMKYYAKNGDSAMLMKYYIFAEEFKSAQIDWEGI